MSTKMELEVDEDQVVMEDINMDDYEDTAFLPGGNNLRMRGRRNYFRVQFIPKIFQQLIEVAGTHKLLIMVVFTFTAALTLLAFFKRQDNILPESLPDVSVHLAEKLAKKLEHTAIPSFVLTYAPIVILDRQETYFPSDLSAHVKHTQPTFNFTSIPDAPSHLNLSNLDELNKLTESDVYLSSRKPVVSLPKWLNGRKPSSKSLHTKRSTNCVIVVVEKDPIKSEDGEEQCVTDAFYLYFYSFNDGPRGLGHQVGNHVGDWEHNMIRFINGTPSAIWYSQHGFGAAYTYDAVQKIGDRPVAFSARGSHSNWPEAMAHDFHDINNRIPPHIAYDYTSVGRLWDPTLSAYFYTYNDTDTYNDSSSSTVKSNSTHSTGTYYPALSSYPTSFLYYNGHWGDQQLRLEDNGQEEIYGFFKWTSGPQGIGWGDKFMVRDSVCPKAYEYSGPGEPKNDTIPKIRECVIKDSI